MDFEENISGKPPHLIAVAKKVRSIILDSDPEIQETIYTGKVMQGAGYFIGKSSNLVAIISPEDEHCKINPESL